MEVQFELTKQDCLEFNLHHLRTSPTAQRGRIFWVMFPMALYLLLWFGLVSPYGGFDENALRTTGELMLAPVFAFLAWRWYWWRVRRLFLSTLDEATNRSALQPRRLVLSPHGIADISADSNSQDSWSAVERIVETDQYAYIYIGALAAHVVPKWAFADESAFQRYVETARQYLQSAQSEVITTDAVADD